MKLIRYGPRGSEKPGLVDANGQIRDLSDLVEDVGGKTLLPRELERLREIDPGKLPHPDGDRS